MRASCCWNFGLRYEMNQFGSNVGIRGERAHRAGVRIERDDARRRRRPPRASLRTPLASACSAARWASRSIVRRTLRPGHGRLEVAHGARRLAERVDRDGVDAVDAAQERVVAALDPALADHVAAVVVVEARILELLGADLGELAVDVRAERAVGVVAQRHLRHREPAEDAAGSPAGTT